MQDGLVKEAGSLFAKSVTRQPSHEDIGVRLLVQDKIVDFT